MSITHRKISQRKVANRPCEVLYLHKQIGGYNLNHKNINLKSMKQMVKLALLALVAWLSITPAVAGKLFSGGKSRYKIVVANDASRSELTAAGELQLYIEKISGAKLEILSQTLLTLHQELAVCSLLTIMILLIK